MTDESLPCSREEAARAFGFAPEAIEADSLQVSATGASSDVWRIRALDGAEVRDTCIVKIAVPDHDTASPMWRTSSDPRDPWYWRREVALLSSGTLDTLPDDHIRPPRLRAVSERDDGSIAMFLEDVDGYPGIRWSFARYRVAARHVGRLHGAYLAGAPLPKTAMLSRGWLASYVDRRSVAIGPLHERDDSNDEPRVVPDAVLKAAMRVSDERARLVGHLSRLPQVVSHLDLHPGNLFAIRDDDGVERTVLVDWQYCGIGAIGEDIATLLMDAVLDLHVAVGDTKLLRDVLLDGYLNGLRSTAPDVDDRLVRFAVDLAATLKYWWVPIHLANLAESAERTGSATTVDGRPFDAIAAAWSGAAREWFDLYRNMRELERTFE